VNTGRFQKGQHWRPRQLFWDRDWMLREYVQKRRSSADIARQFGVTENAIQFWLKKHGIPGRTASEVRSWKHWGSAGPANPMFGKTGVLNPNWRGGSTPMRQQVYASLEWKKFARSVRKRDKACRLCGSNDRTHIHHIQPVSKAPLLIMDIGNVILLCQSCHRQTYGQELRWRKKFYALIQIGGQ
jgi:hypothetical protein